MSYGLQAENPSGGLVMSADGMGMVYLGKASFVQNEAAPDFAFYFGTNVQFKRYRITTTAAIVLPFLALSANICGVAKVEPNATYWDFVVFNQNTSNVCQPLDIYCFVPPSSAPAWGLALYRADGTLSHALGGSRPLMFSGLADFPASTYTRTVPSLTIPAVLGFSSGYIDPSWVLVDPESGFWRADGYVQGFKLTGTTLYRSQIRFRVGDLYEFEVGTSPGSDDYTAIPCTAYLIDANGLT